MSPITSGRLLLATAYRRRSCRGVASIEAVIVLPIFVLMFVGVTHFGKLALARADAQAEARSCAWTYSMNNCQATPPGCEAADPGEVTPTDNDVTEKLDTVRGALTGQSGGKSDKSSAIADIISSLLDGAVKNVFGSSIVARGSRTIDRPPLFGGKTTTIEQKYRLACNIAPDTAESIADKAWNIFRP